MNFNLHGLFFVRREDGIDAARRYANFAFTTLCGAAQTG